MNLPLSRSIRLRPLRRADLAFADSLRAAAGWNQTPRDWQSFLRLSPGGCFLAEWNGASAGIVTTIRYGARVGWIGMLLVHPDYRRRGLGTALLERACQYLQRRRVQSVKLDATPAGRPLYQQLGFQDEWPLTRWKLGAGREFPLNSQAQIRPLTQSDWPEVVRLDAAAFGVRRPELLKDRSQGARAALVSMESSGSIAGFGMIRPGMRAHYLGPVAARSAPVARALIQRLLHQAQAEQVYWDIPDGNSRAARIAKDLGFVPARPLMRMYLGGNPFPGDVQTLFGIADPALG